MYKPQLKGHTAPPCFGSMNRCLTVAPCVASELVHFRKRIKEEGMKLILKESVYVNLAIEDVRKRERDKCDGNGDRGRKSDEERMAFIDTTVREKNVTFPMDSNHKVTNKYPINKLKINYLYVFFVHTFLFCSFLNSF